MTLATHEIVGAAVAQLFPEQPALGFIAAFASHFVLDAIPHWDYPLLSKKEDAGGNFLENDLVLGKAFLLDLLKIGGDFWIGILLAFLIFQEAGSGINWSILIGAIGGMLPDALQFAYFKIRRQPLTSLQKFHHFIHAKKRLHGRPVLGIALQVIVVAAVALLVQ